MQLQELDYQLEALKSVVDIFQNVPLSRETSTANPIFNLKDDFTRQIIKQNVHVIQERNKIDSVLRTSSLSEIPKGDVPLGVDVKMETGTGKTYVYSRLMLELNREYGFNKFIIISPTVPIKEGTRAFLQSGEFKEHVKHYEEFSNTELKLSVLDPQKQNNKGRRYPPRSVNEFCDGDAFTKNSIFCFLAGMSMLKTGKYSTLYRNDYDQTMLDGTNRPIDALAKTRPIVILDEPHKFDRSNQSWSFIQDYLKPLAIVRFGATYPIKKDKTRDYDNLVYNLTSIDAFNRDLVKGVSVYYPEFENPNKTRFTLVSITSKRPKKARFRNEQTKAEYDIDIGESLSRLNESFGSLYIQDIGKQEELNDRVGIRLDNEKVLAVRDALIAGVFTTSYQELMVNQAIELHLQKEQENFISKSPRYKSLTLFFIDSPESYRLKDGSDGKLRKYFQETLTLKVKSLINKYESKENLRYVEQEYVQFLKASLADIRGTNGGYFSQDNSTKEEDIQKEVDEILRDKNKLLSFKNEDGSWNVRRFIFSKWTLREGWDNPNIFTIAKLRSSGSENSKIQEVGRGLRLPVNEFGVRAIAGEESFFLNYLVDHTESEFADHLYDEINEGVANFTNIKGLLDKFAEKLGKKTAILAGILMANEYIDEDYNVIEGNRHAFYREYPDFKVGLKSGKIMNGKPKDVQIRKENFAKIKNLWNDINKNYMVDFQNVSEDLLRQGIRASLSSDLFKHEISSFQKKTITSDGNSIILEKEHEGEFTVLEVKIAYGEFLKKINNRTCLPLSLLHQEIVRFHKETSQEIYPTNRSIQMFVSNFECWFIREFASGYTYRKLSDVNGQTALTNDDGTPKDIVAQADIGVFKSNNPLPEQYLYDRFVYDSKIEVENIEYSNIDRVEVFGKIPRRSIRVPMYFGGTTSPDFMYVLTDKSGNQSMNLIIESKGVDKEAELRQVEDYKIEASKKFFNTLNEDGVNVTYKRQLSEEKILNLLSDLDTTS
ncbi:MULTISPECIES: type III restriction-modification system endonuclease [Bacillus]|uniref:type III restriction-modification system endonuclease n=1 Tax=Bacillus TaxID=1386 RepID=UPI00164262B9|nr:MULTISPECIES: type III restriction-modification system endonuclease [Bacillus amyloliquefaciens group]MBW8585629.1 type III restriction-modification system endonuclease [Bacillus amyloliquefaciens]MBY0194201.1 type III restriction-modification system endonuclease [Bacillus velezensis]MCG0044687.1 type III restriction-modification system endonuclease [Bacillus velezensis]